jgi:hypothetical protein
MEVHGYHHRIFSDAQEAEIASEILESYVIPAKFFINPTFRELAMKNFQEVEGDPTQFRCSDHFIQNFKRPHEFSSRRFHLRRRYRQNNGQDITR